MSKSKWQIKIARSLGDGFAGTFYDAWGVTKYTNPEAPTVFAGMYGLPDFCNFRSHRGKKMLWWAGSDIRNFIAGWWIDDTGKLKVNPNDFAKYLKKYENWVENKVEADALRKFGIKAKIAPSFLGDVSKFTPDDIKCQFYEGEIETPIELMEFKYPRKMSHKIMKFEAFDYKKLGDAIITKKSYYSSVSGNDFELYGWGKIAKIAEKNQNNWYYLYGNTIKPPIKFPKNVKLRGRVSQEEMDNEIKFMNGCIRLLPFEGFSEIVAKAILWGQEVISEIPYNYTRESLLKVLNKYPWQTKK